MLIAWNLKIRSPCSELELWHEAVVSRSLLHPTVAIFNSVFRLVHLFVFSWPYFWVLLSHTHKDLPLGYLILVAHLLKLNCLVFDTGTVNYYLQSRQVGCEHQTAFREFTLSLAVKTHRRLNDPLNINLGFATRNREECKQPLITDQCISFLLNILQIVKQIMLWSIRLLQKECKHLDLEWDGRVASLFLYDEFALREPFHEKWS